MASEDDEANEVERIAIEAGGGESHSPEDTPDDGIPRCPECHRPTDDIESMEEPKLLAFLRLGALKMLARNLQFGQLTHQELAIMRGMIRDNDKALPDLPTPPAPAPDPALPSPNRTPIPHRRERPDFEGTEG